MENSTVAGLVLFHTIFGHFCSIVSAMQMQTLFGDNVPGCFATLSDFFSILVPVPFLFDKFTWI